MPHRAWLLSLILLGVSVCWAEGDKKADQKAPEPKTWVGQLAKTDQALASLKTHPESKDEKPQTLLLFVAEPQTGTADEKKAAKENAKATAKAIADLMATKPLPYATVTGILGQDGKSVQVTSISQAEKPKKGKN